MSFFYPKTLAAKSLVLPEALQKLPQENLYRLIFNGRSSYEPVISGNMVLHCGCPVNIMYADTRDINGMAVGQMVLCLAGSPAIPPAYPGLCQGKFHYSGENEQ